MHRKFPALNRAIYLYLFIGGDLHDSRWVFVSTEERDEPDGEEEWVEMKDLGLQLW